MSLKVAMLGTILLHKDDTDFIEKLTDQFGPVSIMRGRVYADGTYPYSHPVAYITDEGLVVDNTGDMDRYIGRDEPVIMYEVLQ